MSNTKITDTLFILTIFFSSLFISSLSLEKEKTNEKFLMKEDEYNSIIIKKSIERPKLDFNFLEIMANVSNITNTTAKPVVKKEKPKAAKNVSSPIKNVTSDSKNKTAKKPVTKKVNKNNKTKANPKIIKTANVTSKNTTSKAKKNAKGKPKPKAKINPKAGNKTKTNKNKPIPKPKLKNIPVEINTAEGLDDIQKARQTPLPEDKANQIIGAMGNLYKQQTEVLKKLNKKLQTRITENLSKQGVNQKEIHKLKNNIKNLEIDLYNVHNLFNKTVNLYNKVKNIDQSLQAKFQFFINDVNATKLEILKDKKVEDNKITIINKKLDNNLNLILTRELLNSQNKASDLQKKISKLKQEVNDIEDAIPTDSTCAIYTNCGSCTAQKKCGWCSVTNSCVSGDENGPSKGQCNFYNYGPESCTPKRRCGDYMNCGVRIFYLIYLFFFLFNA